MTEEKTIPSPPQNPTTDEPIVLNEDELSEAFEAVLFAAGYPVSYEKLGETFGKTEAEMKEYAENYAKAYNAAANRGILMLTLEDGCQLCTKAKYAPQIRTALGIRMSGRLSPSCMEVLAIVAYHQPVTKAYIEQVRGVDCSYAIGLLCDKNLIEPHDRLDAPGRPFLYRTTDDFLRCFGLDSLAALPENPLLAEQGKDTPAQGEEKEQVPAAE